MHEVSSVDVCDDRMQVALGSAEQLEWDCGRELDEELSNGRKAFPNDLE